MALKINNNKRVIVNKEETNMQKDRNQGNWPELKAKRQDKFNNSRLNDTKFNNTKFDDLHFDEAPLDSLNARRVNVDGEHHDIQKVKKDRAAKHLSRVKSMFKDMSDYADKNSHNDTDTDIKRD